MAAAHRLYVLKAIEADTDTVFQKPTLNSATPTEAEKIKFKIDCEEYSEDVRTYENNKSKIARSLLGQCEHSVIEQLKEMKDHSTGQYDVLCVLSALSQICSGIRKDEIPLLQVLNTIRKVFTNKQQDQQSALVFKVEFVQNVRALKAVGATITLSAACLELEENLDPDKTLSDEVKQTCAFELLMALAYLNQYDNSAEWTRTMLKMQYVQHQNNYPATITVAANLVRAAKKEKTNRSCTTLTLAQRAANSSATCRPSAEHPCDLCGAHDHWQPDCPNNRRNVGAS